METKDSIFIILAISVAIIISVALAVEHVECKKRGGTSVRGLLWMECLEK